MSVLATLITVHPQHDYTSNEDTKMLNPRMDNNCLDFVLIHLIENSD